MTLQRAAARDASARRQSPRPPALVLAVLFALLTLGFVAFPDLSHSLRQTLGFPSSSSSSFAISSDSVAAVGHTEDCPFVPIVFNNPVPLSPTVRRAVWEWGNRTSRKNHHVHCGDSPMETTARLQECMGRATAVQTSSSSSSCAIVVTMSVNHDLTMGNLLSSFLPSHRLMTFTTYPPLRVYSLFRWQYPNGDFNDFKVFLKTQYNPLEILSFHTQVLEDLPPNITCPISDINSRALLNLASKYWMVIDPSFPTESNLILQKHNLSLRISPTPTTTITTTTEHASFPELLDVQDLPPFPRDVKNVLSSVLCYENALHRALQLRMASLYERATMTECVSRGRLRWFSSCLANRQKALFGNLKI